MSDIYEDLGHLMGDLEFEIWSSENPFLKQ